MQNSIKTNTLEAADLVPKSISSIQRSFKREGFSSITKTKQIKGRPGYHLIFPKPSSTLGMNERVILNGEPSLAKVEVAVSGGEVILPLSDRLNEEINVQSTSNIGTNDVSVDMIHFSPTSLPSSNDKNKFLSGRPLFRIRPRPRRRTQKRKRGKNIMKPIVISSNPMGGEATNSNPEAFCWICHKLGEVLKFICCPRVFHRQCINPRDYTGDSICPECYGIMLAESNLQLTGWRDVSKLQLINMLTFLLNHLARQPCAKPFQEVKNEDSVVRSMDLNKLYSFTQTGQYTSISAFLGDFRWILHNCIVSTGAHSQLTVMAQLLHGTCEREINLMKSCPDCFFNRITVIDKLPNSGKNFPSSLPNLGVNSTINRKRNDTNDFSSAVDSSVETINEPEQLDPWWFCKLCDALHPLVWIRLLNYPRWPGKVVAHDGDRLLVLFFGDYDLNYAPIGSARLHSHSALTCLLNIPTSSTATDGVAAHSPAYSITTSAASIDSIPLSPNSSITSCPNKFNPLGTNDHIVRQIAADTIPDEHTHTFTAGLSDTSKIEIPFKLKPEALTKLHTITSDPNVEANYVKAINELMYNINLIYAKFPDFKFPKYPLRYNKRVVKEYYGRYSVLPGPWKSVELRVNKRVDFDRNYFHTNTNDISTSSCVNLQPINTLNNTTVATSAIDAVSVVAADATSVSTNITDKTNSVNMTLVEGLSTDSSFISSASVSNVYVPAKSATVLCSTPCTVGIAGQSTCIPLRQDNSVHLYPEPVLTRVAASLKDSVSIPANSSSGLIADGFGYKDKPHNDLILSPSRSTLMDTRKRRLMENSSNALLRSHKIPNIHSEDKCFMIDMDNVPPSVAINNDSITVEQVQNLGCPPVQLDSMHGPCKLSRIPESTTETFQSALNTFRAHLHEALYVLEDKWKLMHAETEDSSNLINPPILHAVAQDVGLQTDEPINESNISPVIPKVTTTARTVATNTITQKSGSQFNYLQFRMMEAEINRLDRENRRLNHLLSYTRVEMAFDMRNRIAELRRVWTYEVAAILEAACKIWEHDVIRIVDSVKRRQWCAYCGRIAYYYCCWNTCYCNSICQSKHWSVHISSCVQVRSQLNELTSNPNPVMNAVPDPVKSSKAI